MPKAKTVPVVRKGIKGKRKREKNEGERKGERKETRKKLGMNLPKKVDQILA